MTIFNFILQDHGWRGKGADPKLESVNRDFADFGGVDNFDPRAGEHGKKLHLNVENI